MPVYQLMHDGTLHTCVVQVVFVSCGKYEGA